MKDKMLKDYTIKEFFEFFNQRSFEVKRMVDSLNEQKKLYSSCCATKVVFNPVSKAEERQYCCYKEKIKKALNTKNGRENILNVLKDVFGFKFYDFSEEELQHLEQKGAFTRNGLVKIVGSVVGNKYGYEIYIPKNWEELLKLIDDLISLVDLANVDYEDRKKYTIVLTTFINLIATAYKEICLLIESEQKLYSNMCGIYKLYKNKKPIDTVEKIPDFKDELNAKIKNVEKNKDGSKSFENIYFGDITESFINAHNAEVNNINKDKEIKAIINKFYKEIFRTPFDKLSYDQFPSFDDPRAYLLYSGLASKFERKNDDKSVSLMAITQIRLANHLNDINYKDDNLDAKVR